MKPRSATHHIGVPLKPEEQMPPVAVQLKSLLAVSLCATCRFNESGSFILASKRAQDRGCWHHIVSFPNAQECGRYEREPGTDDDQRFSSLIGTPGRIPAARVRQGLKLIGSLTLVSSMLYGCPAVLLLAPVYPPPRGLFQEKSDLQLPSKAETDALLAKFKEARLANDIQPANSAIAVTFTPIPWAWGMAHSLPTEDEAKALALEKCLEDVKLKGLRFPCDVYSVNGRPDPDIAIFF